MTMLIVRVAATLAAIQGLAHAALFLRARPRNGDAEVALIAAMRSGRYFANATRSYWDAYTGYGLVAAGACLVEAALLWQLANIARVNPTLARPVMAIFVAANVAHAALIARYFAFPIPIAFDLAIAACLAGALVSSRG